jgi:hemolysin activation/secretion protein
MSTPQETQQASDPPQQQDLQQQQQDQQQQQQQQQLQQQVLPTANSTPSAGNNVGENLQCQWQGCGERCASAEAIYVSLPFPHHGPNQTSRVCIVDSQASLRSSDIALTGTRL